MNSVVFCSDTGAMAPERCVFGIMLDVSAFLGKKKRKEEHTLHLCTLHVSEHLWDKVQVIWRDHIGIKGNESGHLTFLFLD